MNEAITHFLSHMQNATSYGLLAILAAGLWYLTASYRAARKID